MFSSFGRVVVQLCGEFTCLPRLIRTHVCGVAKYHKYISRTLHFDPPKVYFTWEEEENNSTASAHKKRVSYPIWAHAHPTPAIVVVSLSLAIEKRAISPLPWGGKESIIAFKGSDPAGSTLDHLRLRISIDRGHQIFGANNERMRTKKSLRKYRARECFWLPNLMWKNTISKKQKVQRSNFCTYILLHLGSN